MNIRAAENTRFGLEAFIRQIGKTVPFKVGENRSTEGRIVAAEVTDDGSMATLTLEVPAEDETVIRHLLGKIDGLSVLKPGR